MADATEVRDRALSVDVTQWRGEVVRWTTMQDAYANWEKNKQKLGAQEQRERLNDQVATSSVNSNNTMLSLIHSFTTTYALVN